MLINGKPCILLLHAKPANHFKPLVSVSVHRIAIANSEEIVKFTFVIVMYQPEPCGLSNKGGSFVQVDRSKTMNVNRYFSYFLP